MKKFILAMVTVFALSMVAFADDTTPPADAGSAGTPPAASNKMSTKTTKAKKKHTKGSKKASNKMSSTPAAGGAGAQ